ncbi:hypothetical protein ABER02_14450 [Rossellomorea marisflavi]|uniref:hypothetical protein n=1 Tax=Rossellomorea marisflavi TaxID=189381 RepID=UPI003D283F64
MKKQIIGIVIVLLYAFPFAYYAMHKDFTSGLLTGYGIMIAVTLVLAYVCQRFSYIPYLIIGNILMVAASLYFNSGMAEDPAWDGYFKPLWGSRMVVVVGVLNLIPQAILVWVMEWKRREKQQAFKA